MESMSKEQLLGILSNYTFSNSGKEPLDYSSFKTYSAEALRRIYISILRNKNFVDITNISRDQRKEAQLRDMGWNVIIVWECELRSPKRQETLERLEKELYQLLKKE